MVFTKTSTMLIRTAKEKVMQENSQARNNTPGKSTVSASNTGTAMGIAGSDIQADKMNPDVEVSSTADPSESVEVTPDKLLNKNAPDSQTLTVKNRDSASDQTGRPTVRHTNARKDDTSTGETGAPGGIDAAGPSDSSGGTAGTAGSAGTDIGARP
jgi:hypothetical protein